jgi:hypothetical protein
MKSMMKFPFPRRNYRVMAMEIRKLKALDGAEKKKEGERTDLTLRPSRLRVIVMNFKQKAE